MVLSASAAVVLPVAALLHAPALVQLLVLRLLVLRLLPLRRDRQLLLPLLSTPLLPAAAASEVRLHRPARQ